jgi:adenine-specific DNA-methyltransferase
MNTLRNPAMSWSSDLGLLPIPFLPNDDSRYLLVNGLSGNFCLDQTGDRDRDGKRGGAWSSNVGHYVSLLGENVEVLRYDASASVAETYSLQSIQENLGKFHAYLENSQPRAGMSVIAHAIRVFRQLRNASTDEDGARSLLRFLTLIACATDRCGHETLNGEKWGLPKNFRDSLSAVSQSDWELLSTDLMEGRRFDNLTLRPELLLRHAAGQLFQEAHYEASVIPQLRLEGFAPPSNAPTKTSQGIGVHFTPPSLARMVVEQSLRLLDLQSISSITVFDPACGSGEFLRESIRQLRIGKFAGKVNLIGWDISRAACDMASFVLAWEKDRDDHEVTYKISLADSMGQTPWPTGVDMLLMNPPFVSYEFLSREQRDSLKQALGPLAVGRYDLSTGFVWKAVKALGPASIIGSIIPSSFLEASATAGVREEMSGLISFHLIARLGSPLLFSDALVDAAVMVGKKGDGPNPSGIAFWADYRSSSTSAGLRALRRATANGLVDPVVQDGFSIYRETLGPSKESWAPHSYESRSLLVSLRTLPRVNDLFEIKTGARSGSLKTFEISRQEWLEMPSTERPYFRPAVLNESITFGVLRDFKYIFYPYGDQKIENEDELARKVAKFYRETLKKAEPDLRKRSSKRDPDRWWEMSEPRTWQFHKVPKIVSVSYGDRGSFAYDSSGDYVVVQGYSWRPLNAAKGSRLLSPKVARAYIALLSSDLMSRLLPAVSSQVQGRQWDLSARLLERIPLPNLFAQVDPLLLSKLAQLGLAIEQGEDIDSKELSEAARATFGVRG